MLPRCTAIDTHKDTCLGSAGHFSYSVFSLAKSISRGHFLIVVGVRLKEGVSSLLYQADQEGSAMYQGENKKEKRHETWLKMLISVPRNRLASPRLGQQLYTTFCLCYVSERGEIGTANFGSSEKTDPQGPQRGLTWDNRASPFAG